MGKWFAGEIIIMIDYKTAGVDIAAGNEAVRRIKRNVESTFNANVLTGIGAFGALYDIKSLLNTYQHPVLVQSIDGVGTKMMVAKMMQHFDTIGMDLVSATANDIIVLGATPLTLLDYIANDCLQPDIIEKIIAGMVKACIENEICLVGGETAEMPGTYLPGEHDLVGVITGVVEKDRAILGKDIAVGDVILAFTSSGLHTNGYSLARKLCFDIASYQVDTYIPELSQSIGEALLVPHYNYTQAVKYLLQAAVPIKGMAHITGGGLLENIPRILPAHCSVEIQKSAWCKPPIFNLLQILGALDDQEAYRTFNMGIGLAIFIAEDQIDYLKANLKANQAFKCVQIGRVVAGQKEVRLI